uniref:Peptidyl-prolyl cis-trans isomerase n=1 Tax=Blastobotrys adeninivorans TaxID=409370 RepID=A0A060T1P5_BLAAD
MPYSCTLIVLHTDAGDIKIELFCEATPKTCENFLAHCGQGTYNGTKIHRNIAGFMVQMGDPTGTGKGGDSIWGGKFKDEIKPTLRHNRRVSWCWNVNGPFTIGRLECFDHCSHYQVKTNKGIVSMANSGPDTNGSQFFITYARQVSLDGKYTIFGQVLEGSDTLDKLEEVKVDKKYRPVDPIYIKSVTIHANPLAK